MKLLALALLLATSGAALAQTSVNSGPYPAPSNLPSNIVLPQNYVSPGQDRDSPVVEQRIEPITPATAPVTSSYVAPQIAPSSGVATARTGSEAVQIDGRARVLDPGTILVDRDVVALSGIVGPMGDALCLDMTGMSYRCGERATRRLEQLVSGKRIRCDASRGDQGVSSGVCRDGSTDLAKVLVRDGWGLSDGTYDREENEARQNRRGMWTGSGPIQN